MSVMRRTNLAIVSLTVVVGNLSFLSEAEAYPAPAGRQRPGYFVPPYSRPGQIRPPIRRPNSFPFARNRPNSPVPFPGPANLQQSGSARADQNSAQQLDRKKQMIRLQQNAIKPANATGWRCNAYQALHSGGPNECADPHKGGHWETDNSIFDRVSAQYGRSGLGPSATYNTGMTLSFLNNNANGVDNYGGRCASVVGNAIEAGGIKLGNRPNDAKNWGPLLVNAGFQRVKIQPANAQPGDVAVFQAPASGRQNGHVQMFNGTNWVSDTVQSNFLPSRSRYATTPFVIYRYSK